MRNLLAALLTTLLAHWHGLCGRVLYRTGSIASARRHFERVLHLRGDVFSAYVYLGRLAWCLGDYAGWRREFEHARRTDPEAFARLRHPFELFEPRAAGLPHDDAGERATWRAVRPGTAGSIRRVNRGDGLHDAQLFAAPENQTELEATQQENGSAMDDFLSPGERARFRHLAPIGRDDLAAVDVDEICRRLTGS
jgi:hypothetical protein